MNVAFFIPKLSNRGGVEISTINVVNAMASSSKINVNLIVFNDDGFVSELHSKVNIICLNIANYKKHYLKLIRKFRYFLMSSEIDVVITVESMSYLFSFFPLMTLRNRPKIVVWEHFNYKNDNGRKSRSFLRLLAAKSADLIILLTERDVEEWKKNIKISAKITYIYNVNTFKRDTNTYDLNSKTIIAVGRYTQVKGFDRLIKIWGIFQDKYSHNDWSLEIVGYGHEKVKLEALITELKVKNIKLVDGDNVEENYADASFYCMTSYYEGLPMVLIEAQSFGLPAISFDIFTGPSEIIDDSTGILVTDGDFESYADAINKLITDSELRTTMSLAAFKASNRFSEEAISERWISELNMVNKL